MICENCKKKEATSIYNLSKQKKIIYLCGGCYRELSNDVALDDFASYETSNVKVNEKCLTCGLTLTDFNKTKTFKCCDCYNHFFKYIKQNVKNFDNKNHIGKVANSFLIQKEVKNLEQMIELCLKNNDYTRASKYGEQIKKIKEEYYGKF